MTRGAEDRVAPARLDHLAVMHHHDLFGEIGDDAEIVGDQENRHVERVLQIAHQFQDLGLKRHVERRRRLVGDEERRPADERHGDHRPLAKPAGQFERIHLQRPFGLGKADEPQGLLDLPVDLGPAAPLMDAQGLTELVADRMKRREGGHRLLEHHSDRPAAHGAEFRRGAGKARKVEGAEIGVVEEDAPGGDDGALGQEAENRLGGDGLARTRFADEGDRAPTFDSHRQAVDGLDGAGHRAEFHRQILDRQKGGAG